MDQKGVLSGDLILTCLMTIIIAISLISIVSDRIDKANNIEKISEAKILTEKIASAINDINAKKGSEIKIQMPSSIGNSSFYKVSVDSSGVYIEFDGLKGKSFIYPANIINENTKEGKIEMYPGKTYVLKNKPIESHISIICIKEWINT